MARLKNLENNQSYFLLTYHILGRKKDVVDTWLERNDISKIHAIVEWLGDRWTIKDVSRNGVWIDHHKLQPHINTPLHVGQRISFAQPGSAGWQVEDVSPPENLLLAVDPAIGSFALTEYTLMPDEHHPTVIIVKDSKSGHWFYKHLADSHSHTDDENFIPFKHGDHLVLDGIEWQAFLPPSPKFTEDLRPRSLDFHALFFQFDVSLDEEHVDVTVTTPEKTVTVTDKTFLYLLLHLARQRLNDAAANIDFDNQGWMTNSLLSLELGLDENHVNIHIHRIRKCFAEALPEIENREQLIQRRRGATRTNLSPQQISIHKGHQMVQFDKHTTR